MKNTHSPDIGTIAVDSMITMDEACKRADPTILIMSEARKIAIAIALLKEGIGIDGHNYGNKARRIDAVITADVTDEEFSDSTHEAVLV